MLNFKDEFEHVASNDLTYYVEVEGRQYTEDYSTHNTIVSMSVTDELGEVVDEYDEIYPELREEALYRDYDIENHATDSSHYDSINELGD